jgi:hypothetical protein
MEVTCPAVAPEPNVAVAVAWVGRVMVTTGALPSVALTEMVAEVETKPALE